MRRLACAMAALLGCVAACGDDTKGDGAADAGVDADPRIQKGEGVPPDDPAVLSPPIVGAPLYGCATAVEVRGFVPGAKIDVLVDGAPVASIVGEAPWGEKLTVPALVIGQKVTATQTLGPETSDPSAEVLVRDYRLDFPQGPPKPYIDPTPLYKCGGAIGGRNLVPGATFEIDAERWNGTGYDAAAQIGKETGTAAAQWTYVKPFEEQARVTIRSTMCADKSPPSEPQIVQPEPLPLPAPTMGNVYDGGKYGVVEGVVNGALIDVRDGAASVASSFSPGGAQSVRITPPAIAGHTLVPSQKLCGPPVDGPGVIVQACSELPAATIRVPMAGEQHVDVLNAVPGSRIRVIANGIEIGDGGGAVVMLTRPLVLGDTLTIVQSLGACESQWVFVVETACMSPAVLADPSAVEPTDRRVGRAEYDLPAVPINGDQARIRAVVRYPAETDGDKVPPAPSGRPFPLVLVLHGNHGTRRTPTEDVCERGPPEAPSYRGYDYLLDALARGGMIAVSIDANDLNCLEDRIPERAKLIEKHLELWREINRGNGPIGDFKDAVDLGRIGLAGHSRGGEAVAMAARDIAQADFKILSVLSLAPVDTYRVVLSDRPLLMIVPAADGDVSDNSGARTYDRATGGRTWFKSQMYIHGANHNFFNREWLNDDINGQGPSRLTRGEQEVMLRAWMRGWFDLTLKGEAAHLALFDGGGVVPHVKNAAVFPSFQHGDAFTLDDFEQFPVDAAKNSRGGTVANAGFTSFAEHPFRRTTGAFNTTFFHDTQGLVGVWKGATGAVRSDVPPPDADVSRFPFVAVRATTVLDANNTAPAAFKLGLEDTGTRRAEVPSPLVGRLPLAYAHPWAPKSMMHTLRFPARCFAPRDGKLDLRALRSLQLTFDGPTTGVIGLDQIQLTQ